MQPPLKCFITQLQTCLEQIGEKRNLSKETEDDQMGISELKNIKTEIKKKKIQKTGSAASGKEERISKLEDRI